ncbi:uncharacterized protein LOC134539617 [Bacillus rossius redtenbacheri]|uniref:uncharacterized protein LOC134539617 n=1 Tax=Bacillus rossius redtenbacheri TaxID=93214 RepID=UPI002FDE88F8
MNRSPDPTGTWRTYVPPEAREAVLLFHHDHDLAGHPGADQTHRAIGQYYHWPGRKARRGDGVQQQQPRLPSTPFQTIALDVMGPYPRSPRGKRFLIVITDMFTRWTEAYPCGNSRAATIIGLLTREFLPRWGYPQSALTDNGSQFLGARWRDWCREAHIDHHTTPSYHPRANPTERRNQELKIQLRLRLGDDHAQWDSHVADALFCVRRRVNAATGMTPAEMVQGHNLPLPGEWATHGVPHPEERGGERDQRRTAEHDAARQQQEQYTQHITPQTTRAPPPLRTGDLVFVRVHPLSTAPRNYCAGLAPRWRGPYVVQRRVGATSYRINLGGRHVRKIHRDDLRLAAVPGAPPPDGADDDGPVEPRDDDETTPATMSPTPHGMGPADEPHPNPNGTPDQAVTPQGAQRGTTRPKRLCFAPTTAGEEGHGAGPASQRGEGSPGERVDRPRRRRRRPARRRGCVPDRAPDGNMTSPTGEVRVTRPSDGPGTSTDNRLGTSGPGTPTPGTPPSDPATVFMGPDGDSSRSTNRPRRERHPPTWLQDYVLDDGEPGAATPPPDPAATVASPRSEPAGREHSPNRESSIAHDVALQGGTDRDWSGQCRITEATPSELRDLDGNMSDANPVITEPDEPLSIATGRPRRERHPPTWLQDYVLDDSEPFLNSISTISKK